MTDPVDPITPAPPASTLEKSDLARRWSSLFAARAALAFATVLADVVIARGLGPEVRGSFAVLVAVSSLAAPLCELGQGFLVNYVGHRERNRLESVVFTAAVVTTVLGVLAGALLVLVAEPLGLFGTAGPLDSATSVAFVVLIVGESLLFVGVSLASTIQRATASALARLGRRVGVLTAAGALWLWSPSLFDDVTVLAAVSGIGAIAGTLYLFYGLGFRPSARFSLRRADLGYSIGALPSRLSERALVRVDLVIVGLIAPIEQVAQYAVALAIADVVLMLTGPLAQVLQGERLTGADDRYRRLVGVTVKASAAVAVGLSLAAAIGVPIVYGPLYDEVVLLVVVLAPGGVAFTFVQLVVPLVNQAGAVKAVSVAMMTGAVAGGALVVPLYGAMGIVGAAVGSTVGHLVSAVLTRSAYRRALVES